MRAGGNGDGRRSGLLTGWQAIATHFGRNQSTVRRWAATADLPVHRGSSDKGVAVYAYVDELDAWLTRRSTEAAGRGASAPEATTPEALSKSASEAAVKITTARRRVLAWTAAAATVGLLAGGTAIRVLQESAALPPPTTAEIPVEAREFFLRGTYLWNRRTPEGIAGAIEALNRAIEIHPEYAEAHAGLAMSYNLARQYSGMSGWEAYPRAEAAARRAVELDPGLAQAQAALAFVEFHWHWRVEAGLTRFRQAIQLDPNAASTHMWYASALLLAGQPQAALPVAERAQILDPDNSAVLNIKAQALFFGDDVEGALDLIAEMIAQDPGFIWSYYTRALIRLSQGDLAGYLADYARLGDMIGVPRYRAAAEAGMAALAEAESGAESDAGPEAGLEAMALALFDAEKEFYDRGEALAWDLARHHALVSDADEALRWLRISLNRREERLIGIRFDPAFRPIHDHPDFSALLEDMGFPPQGR